MSKVSDMQIKHNRSQKEFTSEILDHINVFIFELTKALSDLNDSIEKSVDDSKLFEDEYNLGPLLKEDLLK